MSQLEQPNEERSKINFMRNALDKQSSTLDFTLPNNRIIKIRKIDPSSLNITDEEKDKIYANHKEGSPIFILKRRVKDDLSEPIDHEKNKSKITIRRIVRNSFNNGNGPNSLSTNDDQSLVKKMIVGNAISVYENTRDEQTNTVVKSFVFVPSPESSNDINIRSRGIQIENEQNQNSLNENMIESEDTLTGGTYDVELSGPSDDHSNENDIIDKGNELNSHSSDNEDTSASATTSGNDEINDENETSDNEEPNASTTTSGNNDNEPRSNSSGSEIENENLENKPIELIIEEEEETEPIENIDDEAPQYVNMDADTPQFYNLDEEVSKFVKNDDEDQQLINNEDQNPQYTSHEDNTQTYLNIAGEAPPSENYVEIPPQYENFEQQPQQYENFEQLAQQYENVEQQTPQYDDFGGQTQHENNEGEDQQYIHQIDQAFQNEGNTDEIQQNLDGDEQTPNIAIDGEIPQFVNTDEELAKLLDYGDGMQPIEGDNFQPFSLGEEEEV